MLTCAKRDSAEKGLGNELPTLGTVSLKKAFPSLRDLQGSQKSMQILLSRTQSELGKRGEQQQERISRNHDLAIFGISVDILQSFLLVIYF